MTSVFKDGTGGCDGWTSPAGVTGGPGGFPSVFLIIFVLYVNDLPSEVS